MFKNSWNILKLVYNIYERSLGIFVARCLWHQKSPVFADTGDFFELQLIENQLFKNYPDTKDIEYTLLYRATEDGDKSDLINDMINVNVGGASSSLKTNQTSENNLPERNNGYKRMSVTEKTNDKSRL